MNMTGAKRRIILYAHDSYGLGHLRRNLAIASAAGGANRQIVILTGSNICSEFDSPSGVDFIKIPGMVKTGDGTYAPTRLDLSVKEATRLRASLISATVRNFRPDVFVVDKAPLGLLGEAGQALRWLRQNTDCRLVLGLRDVLDEPEAVAREWENDDIRLALTDLYDEIWIYGSRRVYDAAAAYPLLARHKNKITYTGYFMDKESGGDGPRGDRSGGVLVTVGGGGDGTDLLETFLDYYESRPQPPFPAVMVSGPFMDPKATAAIARRCARVGLDFHRFHRCLGSLMDRADLLVCMGGYNTVYEALSRNRACLIVPREVPRREQAIRAEALARLGAAIHLPWSRCRPKELGREIQSALADPPRLPARRIPFSGRRIIRERFEAILGGRA